MAKRTYKYHFIYHIRILVGSKKDYFYVGLHSTNNIDDGYCGSGRRVKNIINGLRKKGYKDNEIYKRTIITFATSRKEVSELEAIYVTEYIMNNPYCLNEKSGGENNYEYSNESCEKMLMNRKGKCRGKNHPMKLHKNRVKISGENNGMYGKHHKEETRKIISKKISKIMSGENNPSKRPEVRAKLSEQKKGENNPSKRPEVRAKMSEIKKGENNPMYGTTYTRMNKNGKNKRVNKGEEKEHELEGYVYGWVRKPAA